MREEGGAVGVAGRALAQVANGREVALRVIRGELRDGDVIAVRGTDELRPDTDVRPRESKAAP